MTHWRPLSEIKTYLKPSRNDDLERNNRYHTTQNTKKNTKTYDDSIRGKTDSTPK